LLELVGFTDIRVTRGHSQRDPEPGDAFLGITAQKPECAAGTRRRGAPADCSRGAPALQPLQWAQR
jgi:hypothetical protein